MTRTAPHVVARAWLAVIASLLFFLGCSQNPTGPGYTPKIYIADTSNHRLIRMDDMDGAGWVTYGTQGSGTGNFSWPVGICTDLSGRIYIADSSNDRIVRISDMSGTDWIDFGSSGSGNGNFNEPTGICVK